MTADGCFVELIEWCEHISLVNGETCEVEVAVEPGEVLRWVGVGGVCHGGDGTGCG